MATNDLKLLQGVLLRLASCDTDQKLEAQLKVFLAPVLLKATNPDAQARAKVMEILSHINKVVKSRSTILLPVEALVAQFTDVNVAGPIKNFTKIYLCTGWPRMDLASQIELAPKLLRGLTCRTDAQVKAIILMLLPVLGALPPPPSVDVDPVVFDGLGDPTTRRFVLELLLDVMRLHNLHGQHVQPKPGETLLPPPPAGLSRNALIAIVGKTGKCTTLDTAEKVVQVKRNIIKFVARFADKVLDEVLPHLFVGVGDGHHQVASDADSTVKRTLDKEQLNSPEVATVLFTLLLGTPTKVKGISPDDRRSPAGLLLRQSLFTYILRSSGAAMSPSAIQAVTLAVFRADSHARLRVQGVQFFHRIAELASTDILEASAPPFMTSALQLLQDPTLELDLQGLIYAAIGKLARRIGSRFHDDFELLQQFFIASHSCPVQVRPFVRDALSMMRSCYINPERVVGARIVNLLREFVVREDASSRLLAVQYANGVFTMAHLPSRYVCLLASTDVNNDVNTEAKRGLTRRKKETGEKYIVNDGPDASTGASFPSFKDAVSFFSDEFGTDLPTPMSRDDEEDTDAEITGVDVIPLADAKYSNVLVYLRNLLGFSSDVFEDQATYELETGKSADRIAALASHLDAVELEATLSGSPGSLHAYRSLIETGLASTATSSLQDEAMQSLLELVAALPTALAPVYAPRLNWLKPYLFSSKESTRDSAGRLIGFIAAELETDDFSALVDEFVLVVNPTKHRRLEDRHGALVALGFVLSCMFKQPEDWRPLAPAAVLKSLQLIFEQLDDVTELVVCAACRALGTVAQCTPLPLAEGELVENSDGKKVEVETTELTKLKVINKLLTLSIVKSKSKSTRINEAAVLCLGNFSIGEFPGPHFDHTLAGLCAVGEVKNIELQFSVGLALSCVSVGPLCTVALDTWYLGKDNDDDDDEGDGEEMATKKLRVEDTKLTTTLEVILTKWAFHALSWSRKSASIWLVAILKHCGAMKELGHWLDRVQAVFTNLLSEGDEFAQDIASKGLGLLYEIGDKETKQELVRILVLTLTEGHKSQARKYSNNASDETVFEEGAMGNAPGKSGKPITTYKELCGIASDLNQPDLIYKFMQLANHNTVWNSRKGAAFGFSTIAAQAREELDAYLPALIPKLYRYQFDPSPSVQTAMSNIWKTVVLEPSQAIDHYIYDILDDLVKALTDPQWRIRQAGCTAVSDVLRGRRWVHLKKHIVPLWERLFRGLDDVKESVRLAAFTACKRLAKTTVNLCAQEDQTVSQGATAAALPVLINSGLMSPVDEIRSFSLGVMIDLSKEAGVALKPHVVEFLMVLLEGLSGLEAPVLNYVAARLETGHRNQDVLENMRVGASKSGPMMDCINRLIDLVDADILPKLVPRLCDMMTKSLGSSTKSGSAHVAAGLANRFRLELGEHCRPLLKALLRGSVQRSAPVRRDFASAIGTVVRASPAADVDMVVKRCRKLYLDRESEEAIEASAAVCRGIAVKAPDVLRQIASSVLPLAYVGTHDRAAVTRKLWEELWSEHTPGTKGGIKLYFTEIINLSLPGLADRSWEVKKQAASAIEAVAENVNQGSLMYLSDQIVDAIAQELQGRTWEGKELLLKALIAVCLSCKDYFKANTSKLSVIHTIVIRELNRKSIELRIAILPCTAKYFKTFANNSTIDELVGLFLPAVATLTTSATGSNGDDGNDSDEGYDKVTKRTNANNKAKLAAESLVVLKAVLESGGLPHGNSVAIFDDLWATVIGVVKQSVWKNRACACDCATQILKNVAGTTEDSIKANTPGATTRTPTLPTRTTQPLTSPTPTSPPPTTTPTTTTTASHTSVPVTLSPSPATHMSDLERHEIDTIISKSIVDVVYVVSTVCTDSKQTVLKLAAMLMWEACMLWFVRMSKNERASASVYTHVVSALGEKEKQTPALIQALTQLKSDDDHRVSSAAVRVMSTLQTLLN